jgi:anti-anti-sigma regulatory factor
MQPRMSCEVRGNHLTVAGSIDEASNFVRLLDHAQDGRLVLDLGGITFINSVGVRQWIRMQQEAAAKQVRVELVRVAEPIVHQLNITPAARGVSIVTSFFAPYLCDNCDTDYQILLDVRTSGTDLAKKRAPAQKCSHCKRELEFTNPPDLYFMFLDG